MLTGKQKLTAEEKDAIKSKLQRVKDRYEFNNLGNYEILYPLKNKDDQALQNKYDNLLDLSK